METKDDILRHIKEFADNAHGDQMRKYTPERYIVHPIQVMEICSEYTNDISILAAALLHDVLEDTHTTEEETRQFLSQILSEEETEKAIKLTIELTDIYTKKAYPQLNRRERKHREHERCAIISSDAQTIKYADIISNSIDITKHDKHFGPKFLKEVRSLLKKMDNGNRVLYKAAVETVDNCLEDINER